MKKLGWRVLTDAEVQSFTTLANGDVSDPFTAWKPWECRTQEEIQHISDVCPDILAFAQAGGATSKNKQGACKCLTQQELDTLIDF